MKLQFTKKALYRLEKEKDVKMGDLQSMGDPTQFKFSLLIDLIWAGRLYQNPALTTDQVIDDVDFDKMGEYAEAIADAVDEAFGDIQVDEKESEGNSKETGG